VSEYSLANRPLEDYHSMGVTHFLVSEWIYKPYLNEPKRFAKEAGFYQTLFERGERLAVIKATGENTGPVITIFRAP
jgi:hypothetical protein